MKDEANLLMRGRAGYSSRLAYQWARGWGAEVL